MSTSQYQPRTQVRPYPYRGHVNSAELQAQQDEIITDLQGIASIANGNAADLLTLKRLAFNELRALKASRAALNAAFEQIGLAGISYGLPYVYTNAMHDVSNIIRISSTPPEHQAAVDLDFGVLLPPRNSSLSMFYDVSTDDVYTIVPREPVYTIQAVAEYDGEVTPGSPLNAFNGNNYSFWTRKISFPLYSDVAKVEAQIIVDVPRTADSNTLQLVPFPYGAVNIDNIEYTTDAGEAWKPLAKLAPEFGEADDNGVIQFTPIKSAAPTIICFQPSGIARLRISFSQDAWIEENGRKTFYYGFQEIGLWYHEWETSADVDIWDADKNNNIIFKISAPDGYQFTRFRRFSDTPGLSYVYWQLSSTQYFDPEDIIWDSDTGGTPEISNVEAVYLKCVVGVSEGLPGYVKSFQIQLDAIESE